MLNEEITTEAAPTIIVVGKSRDDTADSLSGLLEDYFTSYQAGEYGNLSALAPEDRGTSYAKVSEVAEFSIISFEVSTPSEIRAIKPTTEEDFQVAKTERWNGYSKVVVEPFLMQVEVPVTLKYTIFGIEFDSKTKFTLRSSPDQKVWTMPYWGITGASQVGEEVKLKDATITLDGVATMGNGIVVVFTIDRSAQSTVVAIGENGGYAQCVVSSTRCYYYFKDLEVPDTFTLLLDSGLIGFGSESHEFQIELTR